VIKNRAGGPNGTRKEEKRKERKIMKVGMELVVPCQPF
jgi:hypothetical protein